MSAHCIKKEETTISFCLLVFNKTRWCECSQVNDNNNEEFDISKFSLLTWNCWAVVEHCGAQRWAAILSEIERLSPTFVTLQEVTKELCAALKSNAFIRQRYAATDVFGVTFGLYGNVVLVDKRLVNSRTVVTLTSMPTTMNRRLATVSLERFTVATVHLESMYDMAFMRAKQLDQHILPTLMDRKRHVVELFAGDFNMTNKERTQIGHYRDVWMELGGIDGKLPPTTTPSRRTDWRPDRVLYRSALDNVTPISYKLIGCEPIENLIMPADSTYHHISTPSDHYGVFVQFQKS